MGLKSLSLQVILWWFHVMRATRQPELDGDDDDLPSHFFHSVLSFVTLTASFANSIKKSLLLWPFDIQKTPVGTLQIRVSDEFLDGLRVEEEKEMEEMERRGSRV